MSLSKSDTSKLIILVISITSYFHSEHFYSGLAYAHCTTWYIILQILACDKTQPFPTNLAQLRAVETMTLPSYDTSILTTLTYRSARVGGVHMVNIWQDLKCAWISRERVVWGEVGKPREQASYAKEGHWNASMFVYLQAAWSMGRMHFHYYHGSTDSTFVKTSV